MKPSSKPSPITRSTRAIRGNPPLFRGLLAIAGVAVLTFGILIGSGLSGASEDQLFELQADKVAAEQNVESHQERIEDLERQIEERDEVIAQTDEREADLASRESDLVAKQLADDDREAELGTRESGLDARELALDERSQELADRESELDDREADLVESGSSDDSGSTSSDAQDDDTGGAVDYENCDAARAAGAAPVQSGDPGYGRHLDRDGDGVGCE
jgi:hypothetical protein